jgi:hypothetical protein
VAPIGAGRNGLCDRCRHQRVVANTRGSTFSLCELSAVDGGFPKYPPVPVLRCSGFAARGRELKD